MTFITNANKDAQSVTKDSAYEGPLVGFFDSWKSAFDTQQRTASMYGLQYAFQEEDWNQTRAMIEAGVPNAPQLALSMEGEPEPQPNAFWGLSGYHEDFMPSRSKPYKDVARMYSGREAGPDTANRAVEYDNRIHELRKQYPDLNLRTSKQMFDTVIEKAVGLERTNQTNRRSWGGTAGDFAGFAVASFDPTTDPFNFFTMFLGGGTTVAGRIAGQAGLQGTVEAFNQVTGVQENRSIMGLSSGFGDAAMRVGMTAVAGGAFQGLGEGARVGFRSASAGVRRYFRGTPTDPAPPPPAPAPPPALPRPADIVEAAQSARIEANPGAITDYLADLAPLSGIRTGRARVLADMQDMGRQMDDWGGALPAFIRPRTENAAMPGGDPGRPLVDVSSAIDSNARYQAARAVDPKAFERFEKLTERKAQYKRWMDELGSVRDDTVSQTLDAISTRIAQLEAKLSVTPGKNNKAKIKAQIKEAKADRETVVQASAAKETPDIAAVRKELIKIDEQMREIAPLIGRAHSQSNGRWSSDEAEIDEVWKAYQAGRTDVAEPVRETPMTYDAALALTDRVPILRAATPETTKETSALTAKAIVEAEIKVLDEGIEAFRLSMNRMLGETADGNILRVGDHEFNIDKDTIFVPQEDGSGGREITIRQLLSENKELDDELGAFNACSIQHRS